jgi:putative MATE family efflux protein
MLSMGLMTLYSLVDAFWVGQLGPTALAALAPAHFASWILWAIGSVLEVGVPSLVARAVGAGDGARASRAAGAGLQIAVLLGVVSALVAVPFARAVFGFVEASPEATREGTAYLRILLTGGGGIFIFMGCEAILRAAGDTRTPMYFSMGSLLLNGLLDPLLIHGFGPIPRLGVPGAAMATVIAQVAGVVAYIIYFAQGRARVSPTRADLGRPSPELWTRVLRIGVPGGVNAALYVAVYLVLAEVAAELGDVPLAVLGLGNRLESINYLIATGFSVAATTLVGRALGAGDPARANRAGWIAAAQSAAFTGAVGLVFLLIPRELIGLFTDDPAMIAEGARFLRILSLCQLWMGVESALFGGFTGAGATLGPVLISSVISLLRIPAAILLVSHLHTGPVGIWWLLSATCALRGILLAVWWGRGRWAAATVW